MSGSSRRDEDVEQREKADEGPVEMVDLGRP